MVERIDNKRIDGWKAIGNHFGRDRTTVIRWASDHGLPVRKVPGGKSASVFAMASELDEWHSKFHADDREQLLIPPQKDRRPAGRMILAAALAVFVLIAALLWWRQSPKPEKLPENPVARALLIEARGHGAHRDKGESELTLKAYEKLVRLEPDFATGLSELSDAYLAAGDIGAMTTEKSYEASRRNAERALALDPDQAAAHYALGRASYWIDGNSIVAGKHFRQSIKLAPNMTRFRTAYATALSNNGEFSAADREYKVVSQQAPGIPTTEAQIEMLKWCKGDNNAAEAGLKRIILNYPATEFPYYYLSRIYIENGNYAGYLALTRKLVESKYLDEVSPAMMADQEMAFRTGGAKALLTVAATQYVRIEPIVGAYTASLAGNRALLLDILQRADANRDAWGCSGLCWRMEKRWKGDRQITDLLKRRGLRPMEP